MHTRNRKLTPVYGIVKRGFHPHFKAKFHSIVREVLVAVCFASESFAFNNQIREFMRGGL